MEGPKARNKSKSGILNLGARGLLLPSRVLRKFDQIEHIKSEQKMEILRNGWTFWKREY